jgi:hypothetical protein
MAPRVNIVDQPAPRGSVRFLVLRPPASRRLYRFPDQEAPTRRGVPMKFQASVMLEFKAGSISEAGRKIDALVGSAAADHDMDTKVVDLRTPPSDASPPPAVVLPPVTSHEAPPSPRAAGVSSSV